MNRTVKQIRLNILPLPPFLPSTVRTTPLFQPLTLMRVQPTFLPPLRLQMTPSDLSVSTPMVKVPLPKKCQQNNSTPTHQYNAPTVSLTMIFTASPQLSPT